MNKFMVLGVVAGVLAFSSVAHAQVAKDKTVQFDYTLTVDGKEIDTSTGKKPLEFKVGSGQIIPGLEKALMGLKVGDEKTIVVPAAEAYGPVDARGVQTVPRKNFPPDVTIKKGMVIPLQNKQGQTFPATVKDVQGENIVLDFNHPLAGKDLTFKVKIVSVK